MLSNDFAKFFKAAIRAEQVEIMHLPSVDRGIELRVAWKLPYLEIQSDISLTKWFKNVLLPLGDLLDWNQQPQIDMLKEQLAAKEQDLKDVEEEYAQYKRLVSEARR